MTSTRPVLPLVLIVLALPAAAQQAQDTAPTAAPATAPTAAPPAPPTAAATAAPPSTPVAEAEFESIRFRGGFNIGGGYVFSSFGGPIIDITVRLGVQLGRYFGLTLQAQPNVFFIFTASDVVVGAGVNNSLLAELTLFDQLQFGAGPSFDIVAASGCDASGNCAAGSGAGFGLHARGAFIFGGRDPRGGRRSGFSLSVNLHPVFLSNATLFFTTFGLGGDWY